MASASSRLRAAISSYWDLTSATICSMFRLRLLSICTTTEVSLMLACSSRSSWSSWGKSKGSSQWQYKNLQDQLLSHASSCTCGRRKIVQIQKYAKHEDLCLPPHTRYAGSLFHQSKLRPYPPDQPWPNRLNLHPKNTQGNKQLIRRHWFLCSKIPCTWRKYSCLSHQEEHWAGFCLFRLRKLWRYVCRHQNNIFDFF